MVEEARSKCLTQGDEVFPRFDSRRRVEVVAHIHAYRTKRGCIAQPNSDRVGIKRREMMKTDAGENIPSVIKCGKTQVPVYGRGKCDRHRNAQFRVDDQKLPAAIRYLNLGTC